MATIHNSDTIKELIQGGKVQTSFDKVPTELAEKIVPVMECNPKLLRRINLVFQQTATNSTSVTLYTTPTDRDFFVTSAQLGLIKDATSTSVSTTISAVVNGQTIALLKIPSITLTAQSEVIANTYAFPIKIDRGSIIAVTNSTAVANVTANATITGYVDDISAA